MKGKKEEGKEEKSIKRRRRRTKRKEGRGGIWIALTRIRTVKGRWKWVNERRKERRKTIKEGNRERVNK